MAITNRNAVEAAKSKVRDSWYAVDNLIDRGMQDDLIGWDVLLGQAVALFRRDVDALAEALGHGDPPPDADALRRLVDG
jgi:hypothetical protein